MAHVSISLLACRARLAVVVLASMNIGIRARGFFIRCTMDGTNRVCGQGHSPSCSLFATCPGDELALFLYGDDSRTLPVSIDKNYITNQRIAIL